MSGTLAYIPNMPANRELQFVMNSQYNLHIESLFKNSIFCSLLSLSPSAKFNSF
jgi:hypothetical protein